MLDKKSDFHGGRTTDNGGRWTIDGGRWQLLPDSEEIICKPLVVVRHKSSAVSR
ncbi:MAG: hypothetical protein IPN76_23345 [Saprospiraceae bacterium]|nr:hypothetical protein [Saprospiraceae bacterium]